MFRFTTAGESHGQAVVVTIEGVPAGLDLDIAAIDAALKRRQGGYGRGGRMAIERDQASALAGLRAGRTLGSPIVLSITNKDHTLDKLGPLTQLRPGHADLAGCLKYGTRDARNVLERASARETAGRVLVGAVAAQVLKAFGIECFGHVVALGGVAVESSDTAMGMVGEAESTLDWIAWLRERRDSSPFYSLSQVTDEAMKRAVDEARRAGDTLGGSVEVMVVGVPPGLGNGTQWDRKLDALIAQACMSVQAIKSVEIGMGAAVAARRGSEVHDAIVLKHEESAAIKHDHNPSRLIRPTNRAGGIEGGMSNGMPIMVRCAMKPIATLMRPLATVDIVSGEAGDAAKERSDICAVPAASVVLEHAVAVPICAALLEKFGGDSMAEVKRNFDGYMRQLAGMLRLDSSSEDDVDTDLGFGAMEGGGL